MLRPVASRLARRLWPIVVVALLGSILVSGASLAAGGATNHFRASIVDGIESEGLEAAESRDILHFEEEAEQHPVSDNQILVSRCRFDPFAGATGMYAPLASWEHDVIVDDTDFAFADGTSCWNPQNEQNIVINPTNPNNLVTSANDYRFEFRCFVYVSMDGGDTWQNVALPGWSVPTGAKGNFKSGGCGGDPVVAFGPDGTLYFAGLTYFFDQFPAHQGSGVAVASSKDGGLHWTPPVMVHYASTGVYFNDKEWIGVGPDGTVYLTWTKFYQGPRGFSYLKSPIVMATSTTGGKTWSSVKQISDASHPFNQGSQVGVTSDGTVYVSYEASSPTTNYATDAMVVARSTDGGRTFSNTEIARVFDDLDCYPIQQPGGQGRQTLTGEQFRMNSYPSMAIDPTSDEIAIVWADNEGNGSCGTGGTEYVGPGTSNQIKLVTSSDGVAWSDPRVITDTPADKVFPSVGFNGGLIAVGYYTRDYATEIGADRRCGIVERDDVTLELVVPEDPDRANAVVCLDWAVRTSADDFGTQVRVTSESSNPYILFAGSFIGDYTGTAVGDDGTVYTVWTDFRGNPGVTSPNQDTLVGVVAFEDLPQ
jgi:hypothetical protein